MTNDETRMTNERTGSSDQIDAAQRKTRRQQLMKRAQEVFGKYSGLTDMARNHDKYFAESILRK
jgi:hypothetical protein